MVVQRFIKSIGVISLALIAVICYDGFRLFNDYHFNDSLDSGDDVQIHEPENTYWQFANAFALANKQDFRGSVKAYAAVNAQPRDRLWMDTKYNLANLFFREAQRLREEDADDLAMPLLELAKQNYKELLRIDSQHWDAKYNLELTLILSPDLEAEDTAEERKPEHSKRALTVIQARKPLP